MSLWLYILQSQPNRRRSLQQDLKAMLNMGLLVSEGATNRLISRMKKTG